MKRPTVATNCFCGAPQPSRQPNRGHGSNHPNLPPGRTIHGHRGSRGDDDLERDCLFGRGHRQDATDTANTDAGIWVTSPQYQTLPLTYPIAVCADGKHSLYICDGEVGQIFQYDLDAHTTTLLARSPNLIAAQPDGLGRDAGFFEPDGCVFDTVAGVLYVSDKAGNLIRKIE